MVRNFLRCMSGFFVWNFEKVAADEPDSNCVWIFGIGRWASGSEQRGHTGREHDALRKALCVNVRGFHRRFAFEMLAQSGQFNKLAVEIQADVASASKSGFEFEGQAEVPRFECGWVWRDDSLVLKNQVARIVFARVDEFVDRLDLRPLSRFCGLNYRFDRIGFFCEPVT